ncbi:MAG: PEP/pyruvate-binding domain-containing protein, partial [bacterium]
MSIAEGTFHKLSDIAHGCLHSIAAFFQKISPSRDQKAQHDAQISKFQHYYLEFRKMLTANNDFLENIADLEDKLLEKQYIDLAQIKRKVLKAVVDIYIMINSINIISSNRYSGLNTVFNRIKESLGAMIDAPKDDRQKGLVLKMSAVTEMQTETVGGKMANLAAIRNKLQLPTSDGFVVTNEGCEIILTESKVRPLIQAGILEDITDTDNIKSISDSLQEWIFKIKFPTALEQAILTAYDHLVERLGSEPRLAVRSSALREDSSLSFAGQFTTELNVPRDGLIKAYLKVIASLFSPEAIQYRLMHGIGSDFTSMAVGFIEMIDSAASGVMFSNDPNNPDPGQVLIHAVHGLGVTLVDGRTMPEKLVVSRGQPHRVLARTPAVQFVMQHCMPDAGFIESELDEIQRSRQILTDEEAVRLAEWALKLDEHFGGPQDIEWTVDQNRRFCLLQSRPLRMTDESALTSANFENMPVLLTGGETAFRGIGTGAAVHMSEDDDLDMFPEGGVLVAQRSSPKFVRIMHKARAIVTDTGSTTGHMASLSREFRIPTLLSTKNATQTIPNGAPITVDAAGRNVYSGILHEAAQQQSQQQDAKKKKGESFKQSTQVETILKKIEELITPLHLTNPEAPDFNTEGCRTLHDISRFVHEMAYKEMFSLGLSLDDYRSSSYHLGGILHTDLYIIDLGEGIEPPAKGRKIRIDNVLSIPLKAFLSGLLHPDLLSCYKPIDAGGFLTLMARHTFTNPETEDTFGYPSYAL